MFGELSSIDRVNIGVNSCESVARQSFLTHNLVRYTVRLHARSKTFTSG